MNSLPRLVDLNQWCRAHAISIRFHSVASHSPRLINDGFLTLDSPTRQLAKKIQATLKVDEWHALVQIELGGLMDVMHYRVVRYSDMLALRQLGKMPTGLAATVLPWSPKSNALLLQKRSANSHLFPGFLSLLGGGFNPNLRQYRASNELVGTDDLVGDNDSPVVTAQRELMEESALQLVIPENTLVTVTQETDNGAMQINYLGVPTEFIGAHADEDEGVLVELPVPQIEQITALENLTDLAKANLTAWLMVRNFSGCDSSSSR